MTDAQIVRLAGKVDWTQWRETQVIIQPAGDGATRVERDPPPPLLERNELMAEHRVSITVRENVSGLDIPDHHIAPQVECVCGWWALLQGEPQPDGTWLSPTPAEAWRREQEHLAVVAAADHPIVAGTLVVTRRRCPDDGACHHGCTTGCFRVFECGPLSGVYPDDKWPVDVYALHSANDGRY